MTADEEVTSTFDPSRQIQIIWSVEDVLAVREDLTEEQALEVLKEAERKHNAEIGINWDVLRMHADMMF